MAEKVGFCSLERDQFEKTKQQVVQNFAEPRYKETREDGA